MRAGRTKVDSGIDPRLGVLEGCVGKALIRPRDSWERSTAFSAERDEVCSEESRQNLRGGGAQHTVSGRKLRGGRGCQIRGPRRIGGSIRIAIAVAAANGS